jgi:hypothetical protein
MMAGHSVRFERSGGSVVQANDKDEKKYAWSFKDGKMTCCTSETSTCNVSKLWELAGVSEFHDADLQQATKEINAILDAVRKTNRDPKRSLNFVQIRDRHFLAWTEGGIVGPHDDDQTLRKALKLKEGRV